MDNSWLFENEEKEEEEESDVDEQTELEERLYAVVHHNDLSQPLPSELAKHYTIQCADDGELEISLKNPLEVVKATDSENICNLLKTFDSTKVEVVSSTVSENKDDDDDDVIIISSDETKIASNPTNNTVLHKKNNLKRFRYSDMTLEEFQGQENNLKSTGNYVNCFEPSDETKIASNSTNTTVLHKKNNLKRFRYSDMTLDELQGQKNNLKSTENYVNCFALKCKSKLFRSKKNLKFKHLRIPQASDQLDCRINLNANFVPRLKKSNQYNDIVHNMTIALAKLNPNENESILAEFARVLYNRKVQTLKSKQRKVRIKAKKFNDSIFINNSLNVSNEIIDLREKIQEYKSEIIASKCKREDKFKGSVSLNVSAFRPDPSSPDFVDLSSDVEETLKDSNANSSGIWKENLSSTYNVENSHFPTKWTKEMIKFYSKRCKKDLDMSIDKVIANLRKTSGGKNWYLDPRDRAGYYQRLTPLSKRSKRCTNCREKGHLAPNCYKPIVLPTCTLCGELYHTDYSCPNKVCSKCGTFITGDVFGGECNECYYAALNGEEPCSICREVTHKASNCTDLWRSFHATTEGVKKVPENAVVNKRKSCCNCGRKGHFSHDCPFNMYSGQQISPFVKNYSAESMQIGSVDVIIPQNYKDILYCDEGDQFFHTLSDRTQAVIEVSELGYDIICNINGTIEQCKKAKSEIENYVNTKKRKREEPESKRKRQKIGY